MTTKKHLKRRVRRRAAQTGEPYATALRNIRRQSEHRMSTSSASPEHVIASCSFCGKPSSSVGKLVAGPSVYICDECVALSAAIVEEANHAFPDEESRERRRDPERSTDEILAMLPNLVRTADRIEAEVAGWVHRLRDRGIGWAPIAAAAGVSTEAARRRFEVGAAD